MHGTATGFGSASPSGSDSGSDWDNAYAIAFASSGAQRFTIHSKSANAWKVCGGTCYGAATTRLTDLTLDASGRLWAMEPDLSIARRTNANGTDFSENLYLPSGSRAGRAALGPDGHMWLAAYGNTAAPGSFVNAIIRLRPNTNGSGFARDTFTVPAGVGPNDITAGPDGALWFTEFNKNSIGRLTTGGAYSSYPVPSAASNPGPYGIAAGGDGALWFTEFNGGRIGRLDPRDPGPTTSITPTSTSGAGADKTKPSLGSLKFSRAIFAAAKSGASTSAKKKRKVKIGTKVSFALSEASSVKFTVQRKATGRKVGRKCAKPKRSNRKKRKCTRWEAVKGSFTVAGKAGRNSFTFRGRMGRKSLKTGSYRLNGTATDAAKNASVPKQKTFKIVR